MLTGFSLPAQAQVAGSSSPADSNRAQGLIVRYAEGVQPVAPDGEATGENFAGVALGHPRDLGDGLFALDFELPISSALAASSLAHITRDRRVVSAQLDSRMTFGPAAKSERRATPRPMLSELATFATPFKPAAAPRAASAPLNLRVFNSVTTSAPRAARLKLTWTAPSKLYGAKVSGYRIERKSSNSAVWTTAISNTARSSTIAFLTAGVQVGVNASYRVKAITVSNGSTVVGAVSSAKNIIAKVAPLAPVLTSANVLFAGESATWANQNLAERGGDTVTYVATATSNTGKSFQCATTSNSCSMAGLSNKVPYKLQVSAQNSVAKASTEEVADAMYTAQWHLYSKYSIHADKAWQVTKGSIDVVVAVLDSGITDHPDLNRQILPGYDFISDETSSRDGDGWDSDPTDNGDWDSSSDSSWHGTHVSGIIAATANSFGVRGVAPNVKILPLRILGTQGGAQSDLIAAVHWASGMSVAGVPENPTPAKVINLSLGTESAQGCDRGSQSAMQMAWDVGTTTVTAAGNSSFQASNSYPGNCYPTINVGATGVTGDIASYSNFGSGVDFSAPGGDSDLSSAAVAGSDGMILSTWNLGTKTSTTADYGLEEGTSMAAPVVSGVIALIYSVRPDLSSEDVYEVLKATVQPFKPGTQCALTSADYGSQTKDSHCGAGIVDAGAAVRYALSYVRGGK